MKLEDFMCSYTNIRGGHAPLSPALLRHHVICVRPSLLLLVIICFLL